MPLELKLPLEGLQHAVAIDLLLHGPMSRKRLASRLGVSAGTLTRVASALIDAGLLVERTADQRTAAQRSSAQRSSAQRSSAQRSSEQRTAASDADASGADASTAGALGAPRAGIGRPEEPLDVELGRDFYAGVKVTASTLHVVVTTLRAQLVEELSRPVTSLEPVALADQIANVVDLVRARHSIRAVGVGLGGQVVDSSVVAEAPLLGWTDVDLGALLRDRIDLPVVIDNDVLSLVRAERWFGAAKDCDHFALLTIGAGIGYGLVAGSGLLEGPDPGLSTITHFPLDIGGGVCSQGHTGCAESLLITKAILTRAHLALGDDVTLDDVLRLAGTDPAAASIVETAAYGLGKLVASVANLALPKKIILTGDGVGLALANREALDRGISDHRNRRASPIDLEIQTITFAEWARGAAATAIETFVVGR